jgi:hypothetical protein
MLEEEAKDRLAAHGERIRKSGCLGKSQPINRLFELLLERSLAGVAPKEVEIAQTVFGRSTDVDLASDTTVRVNVHRLRKKLEELAPDENGERIALPRGEYRLVLVPPHVVEVEPGNDSSLSSPRKNRRWLAGTALLLAFNLLCWVWFVPESAKDARLDAALWRSLASSSNPTLIIVGDQYVFGEQDASNAISRVVADRTIGSREDLDQYKVRTPGADNKYIDLNAHHLPEGLAPALAGITPILMAPGRTARSNPLRSITMSRFTNDMLRDYDIVYIGLLGNLGEMQEPLSDISGFSLSEDDDSVVDRMSGERFRTDWADPSTKGIMRRDYAYLASLPGPSGNHIVVIAGTRDPALMEAIRIASEVSELNGLTLRIAHSKAFEALYEVRTFGPSNISAKLLIARPLKVDQMWPARQHTAPASSVAPATSRSAR